MTEENKGFDESPEYRAELLERCQLLGIAVHPNAKNETIAAKIKAKMAEQPTEETPEVEEVMNQAARAVEGQTFTTAAGIEREAAKSVDKEVHPLKRLHRVIITCNDPQKADQTGDIVSVSNSAVGNIRFYFHFGKPWHVPEIVLNTLEESKLFLHSSRKDGKEIITREVPRYNIQRLAPLDEKQRERIAAKQAAALATED